MFIWCFKLLEINNPSRWNVNNFTVWRCRKRNTDAGACYIVRGSIGECPHIRWQPSHYCFSRPPTNNGKMETQSAPRDLRSVSSVLWWWYLNCLLIYNYTVCCVFGLLSERVCVRAHICGLVWSVSSVQFNSCVQPLTSAWEIYAR